MENNMRTLKLLVFGLVAGCSGPALAAPAGPAPTQGLVPVPAPSPAADRPSSLAETVAAEQRGDLSAALAGYHSLLTRPQSLHVQVYLRGRIRALSLRIQAAQVPALLQNLDPASPVRPWLVLRQAELLTQAGKERAARKLLAATKGLDPGHRRRALAAAGHPRRIGALVPLSGRLRGLGWDLLRGMILAADLSRRSRGHFATIVARDSARDPVRAAAALAGLGVVAAVGVPLSGNARLAAPVCQKAGVPLLVGADGKSVVQLGSAIFRAVHSPIQRARALARYLAATRKVTRVAILHPANGYGRRVAKAFADEAGKSTLVVVATVAYNRKDTALYKRFKPLAAKGTQAVFVADSAIRLELVAPQLGLAGLQAAPLRKLGKGKVLLLSTAEGLRSRLVTNVGHSVAGAVLAPGFYPDALDPRLGTFVKAFQKVFGRAPGRYAALGYLTVLRIRTLLVRRAQGRVSLVKALAASTGTHKKGLFDKHGERTDPPRLYRVHTSGIRLLTTRTGTPGLRPPGLRTPGAKP
jgi:ABC-type branched-subunit amino acid transport system substrate-binding protein